MMIQDGVTTVACRASLDPICVLASWLKLTFPIKAHNIYIYKSTCKLIQLVSQ